MVVQPDSPDYSVTKVYTEVALHFVSLALGLHCQRIAVKAYIVDTTLKLNQEINDVDRPEPFPYSI
jgi:hypothetical protein